MSSAPRDLLARKRGAHRGRSAHRHRDRSCHRFDHQGQGRPGHLADHCLALPGAGVRRRLRRNDRGDHPGLRRNHGGSRAAHRVRCTDRSVAARHRSVSPAGGCAGSRRRCHPTALRALRAAVHNHAVDLRRRAGGVGRAGGPHGLAVPGPQRAPGHGVRRRRRHLRRLRLRHSRPGRDLHRRLARCAARHVAALRNRDRPAHRHHHQHRDAPAAGWPLLEAGDGRRPRRGDGRAGGPRDSCPRRGRRTGRCRCSCCCCRSWCPC